MGVETPNKSSVKGSKVPNRLFLLFRLHVTQTHNMSEYAHKQMTIFRSRHNS